MEKIIVDVAWCDRNYGGSLGSNVPGAVVLTAPTFEVLQKEAKESLEFHIEGLMENGEDVPEWLKFEGGTHRVQRVPETESQGRVHTSAITVAIMPEVEDSEIEIKESDLKIDVMRSSGHGGQSVNTTDSAVRVTHIPTGLVVVNQDGKSQHKNKDAAIKVLKARLFEMQERERAEKEREQRVWGCVLLANLSAKPYLRNAHTHQFEC